MEILSPAGSYEGLRAAVQNGADAVYLGLDNFNARRNAKNLTLDEFASAAAYCRSRGVSVYVTMNTLLSDRELIEASELVRKISRLGADAVIVQDYGVLRMVKMSAPSLAVHASTQMGIHNLDGVKYAHKAGISRVILARELTRYDLAYICKYSPIEIEVFVHGALCVCYSGQCYMSSLIGRRSGNRGLCAQPCRLPYGMDGPPDGNLLSLRDLSLLERVRELEAIGIKALKIEGRMKRPEYVAIATKIYSDALHNGKEPSPEDIKALEAVSRANGFTDGYYENKKGQNMFGSRTPGEADRKLLAQLRATYKEGEELLRTPVGFYAVIKQGEQSVLAVSDAEGRVATVRGPVAQQAHSHVMTEPEIKAQLQKTGGTNYYCDSLLCDLDENISIPLSAINGMRREALSELTKLRSLPPEREDFEFKPGLRYLKRREPPVLNIQVLRAEQLHPDLITMGVQNIYLPLWEIAANFEKVKPYLNSSAVICAVFPRVIHDHEAKEARALVKKARALGIKEALLSNPGHVKLALDNGFDIRADFGFGVFNSQAFKELKHMGFLSAVCSFELSFAQIRSLSMSLDTEMIAYGRLPLMLTENCLIKNHYGNHSCETPRWLRDRQSALFPVIPEYNCRNVIYNSKKLYLADKREDYSSLGLWAVRLCFTTENARECIQVAESYMGLGKYTPNDITRGLYYRKSL